MGQFGMVTCWATETKKTKGSVTNRKSSCASYFGGARAYTHKTGQSDARPVDAKEIPGVGEERGGQQCDRERDMATGLTPSLHLSLPSRRPTSSKQTKAHSPKALRADPEQERDDCREEDEIGGERLAKLLALEVHGVSPRALPPCFSRSAPCTCTTWPCPRLDDRSASPLLCERGNGIHLNSIRGGNFKFEFFFLLVGTMNHLLLSEHKRR